MMPRIPRMPIGPFIVPSVHADRKPIDNASDKVSRRSNRLGPSRMFRAGLSFALPPPKSGPARPRQLRDALDARRRTARLPRRAPAQLRRQVHRIEGRPYLHVIVEVDEDIPSLAPPGGCIGYAKGVRRFAPAAPCLQSLRPPVQRRVGIPAD